MSDDTDTEWENEGGSAAGKAQWADEVGRQFEAGAMDVAEWNGNFLIRMDLPGVDRGGLSLDVTDDDELEIVARRGGENEVPIERYLFRERTAARIERSISLPTDVDEEEMSAEYDEGILTVVLPKE